MTTPPAVYVACSAFGEGFGATFGATPERVCRVAREFWRNGEGWYSLVDTDTGETFESPDIFWNVTITIERMV